MSAGTVAGYPDGRRGDAIPLLSRVIATCDAFVAIASDRPHRRGVGAEAALEHVRLERGSQFDPRTVDALVAALAGDDEPEPSTRLAAVAGADLARDRIGVQTRARRPAATLRARSRSSTSSRRSRRRTSAYVLPPRQPITAVPASSLRRLRATLV